MKTTLGAVVETHNDLKKLASKSMSIKGAYAVAKNIRILEPEMLNFEERRKDLFQKYFEEVEGRTVCKDQAGADKEFGELVTIEVEIEPYKMDLDQLAGVQIEPASLFSMMWMIKEENA